MQDIIGSQYGIDIVGAQMAALAQAGGCPPYAYGNPAGYGGFQGGFPAAWAQMAMQQAAAAQGAPGSVDQGGTNGTMIQGFGPGGFGGFGPGGFPAPWGAPLAVQQVQQELLGVQPRCYTRLETQFVGLGTVVIPPCGTAILTCSPCIPMKIVRFVISSAIAYQLQVDQITVNGKDQLINCGPVSAALFIETATDAITVATETIQQGCCIQIQLTNISDADVVAHVDGKARVCLR